MIKKIRPETISKARHTLPVTRVGILRLSNSSIEGHTHKSDRIERVRKEQLEFVRYVQSAQDDSRFVARLAHRLPLQSAVRMRRLSSGMGPDSLASGLGVLAGCMAVVRSSVPLRLPQSVLAVAMKQQQVVEWAAVPVPTPQLPLPPQPAMQLQ
ncbi:MAG: hypothetical protein WCC18_04950 [Candidatus Acidiferrales bacterium]